MYIKTTMLFVLMGMVRLGYAQQKLTYKEVDSRTYVLYTNEEWKALISLGEEAVKQGFDFYYLHVRMGVAYYERQSFYKAIESLQKALDLNATDFAREFLYYSFLNTGQDLEAADVAKDMTRDFRREKNIRVTRPVDFAYLEGTVKLSDKADSAGNIYVGTFGLAHRLGSRFRLYHAYTFVTQDLLTLDYSQNQYYLSPTVYLGKGFSVQGGFHYVGFKGQSETDVELDTVVVEFPELPPPAPDGLFGTDSVFRQNFITVNTEVVQKAYIGYLGAGKNFGRFRLQAYASYSNYQVSQIIDITDLSADSIRIYVPEPPPGTGIDFAGVRFRDTTLFREADSTYNITNWQVGAELNYVFPFWDDRLSIGLDFAVQIADSTTTALIWPNVAIRATRFWWLQLNYFSGGTSNFLEQRASIVNNTTDVIDRKLTLLNNFTVRPKVNLFLLYQYEQRREETLGFDYNFNTIIAGLKIMI